MSHIPCPTARRNALPAVFLFRHVICKARSGAASFGAKDCIMCCALFLHRPSLTQYPVKSETAFVAD